MKQFFNAVVSKISSLHAIFIIAFTVLLSVSSWLIWNQLDFHVKSDLIKQYQSITETTAKQAAQTAKPLIESQDWLSLQVYTKESIEKRKLENITFYSPSQEVLAYANSKNTSPISQRVTSSLQITSNQTTLGSVSVTVSTKPIQTIIQETTSQIILIALAVWTLGIILIRSLFHWYEGKVAALSNRIKQPSKEAEITKYPLELRSLENEINNLSIQLSEKQELENNLNSLLNHQSLHKDTPPSHNQRPAIHSKSTSVLYVQALGLNQLKDRLSDNDSARLITEYVSLVQQAAKLYNGFVQVQANGLAILFGAPQAVKEHCLHAVCAASFLCRLLNNHNNQKQQDTKPLLRFQLAIHTGTTFCFDSPEQTSPAIFGDVIFKTAQIADLAKQGQILLSSQAYEQKGLADKVECKGPYNLGKNSAHLVYQVHTLADNYEKLIERQVKHIASLRQPA